MSGAPAEEMSVSLLLKEDSKIDNSNDIVCGRREASKQYRYVDTTRLTSRSDRRLSLYHCATLCQLFHVRGDILSLSHERGDIVAPSRVLGDICSGTVPRPLVHSSRAGR